MKGLGLLTAWIAMSFWSFSQTLEPSIQIIEDDTLYCFSYNQLNTVGKHLANSRYCDSLEVKYVTNIERLNEINRVKDTTIVQLQHKIINLNTIGNNNVQSIGTLQKLVETKDKKLRRSGTHKKLLTLGLVIIGIVAIIN